MYFQTIGPYYTCVKSIMAACMLATFNLIKLNFQGHITP